MHLYDQEDSTSSLTLLCVEDSATTQKLYETLLHEHFQKIFFAQNAKEGLEIFMQEEIDIIITDYQASQSGDLEMIEQIRVINNEIPIILVTANEQSHVLIQAIKLNVTNFFLEPIEPAEVLQEIQKVIKIVRMNSYLKKKKKLHLQKVEEQNKYNAYQENLALQKELMILRNDFYFQMLDLDHSVLTLDYMYKPLDTLSGDAFSARCIANEGMFLFLVDGMGKGISASLTAMLITTFVNHTIDKNKEITLQPLIEATLEYVKVLLLPDEILSVEFVLIDRAFQTLKYAKFSMPSTLLLSEDGLITKLKSNNPPISRFTKTFQIKVRGIQEITKILFYSDGISENNTRFEEEVYADYLESDFKKAFTKDELKDSFLHKIDTQEDDITFIMLHKIELSKYLYETKVFDSKLSELEEANGWYNECFIKLSQSEDLSYKAAITFGELMMNALEHGSFKISMKEKHALLQDGTYFDVLYEKEELCRKKITVSVTKIDYIQSSYIATTITDEGDGFDTNILSDSFKNIRSYNGRGIYLSRINSNGIHYNQKGNKVIFFMKC